MAAPATQGIHMTRSGGRSVGNFNSRVTRLEAALFANRWRHLQSVPVRQWPDEALIDAILDDAESPEASVIANDKRAGLYRGDERRLFEDVARLVCEGAGGSL